MNKLMFTLLTAVTLTLTLGACSHSSSGGSNGNGLFGASGGPSDSSSQHKESYRFNLNNCDTLKQEFVSASADDAHKQMCEGLENDQLNHSCAEPLRKQFFEKVCTGYTWNPIYAAATPAPSTVTPPNTETQPAPADAEKKEQIRQSLEYLFAESVAVSPALTGLEKDVATQYGQDLLDCGLSYMGSECLDSLTSSNHFYIVNLVEVDGKKIFYSESVMKGLNAPIMLMFSVDQIDPILKVSNLVIAKASQQRMGRPLAEYLKNSSNITPLLNVTLATGDLQQLASQRLARPRDIRELYHAGKLLLSMNSNTANFAQIKTKILKAIKSNQSVIVNSQYANYQEQMISLITNELQSSSQLLIEVCEGLLNASSENIQQIAATTVFGAQPSRVELKPKVLAALDNSRWDIRRKAVQALSSAQKSIADENLLLAKLADPDEDVRKAAITAAANISVTDQHLETIQKLSESPNWYVRFQAAKQLGRVNTEKSTATLIKLMDDTDEDVRKCVVTLLDEKTLTAQNLTLLSEKLKSSNWSVRNETAKLIGKNTSSSSVAALIAAMNDTDEDVRTTIFKALDSKTLGADEALALSKQYQSSNWSVRRDVSRLLGKIEAAAATTALIRHMNDSDEDVRTTTMSQLANRRLSVQFVPDLAQNFSSPNWSVRRDTAKLLGKIKSPASLSALEDQLVKESDSDAKSAIVAAIKAVRA